MKSKTVKTNMNEIIEAHDLLNFISNAKPHEIYRLSILLNRSLNDSKLIQYQRSRFKVGDIIEYFDSSLNKYVKACVLEKNRTRVFVENCDDHERWNICYLSIKLDSRDFVFSQTKKGLSKHELAVGDCVGFSHDGEEIVGSILRLNQKSVTLVTKNQKRWRVGYGFLYTVIEGESGSDHGKLIQIPTDTEKA